MMYLKSQAKSHGRQSNDLTHTSLRALKKRRNTQSSISMNKNQHSLLMAGQKTHFEVEESKQPLKSSEALKKFHSFLTKRERKEILSYPTVYFVGMSSEKSNDNIISEKDHLAYRYEVQKMIGEGTFSQVWAAVDHKDSVRVAIKAFKDMEQFRGHSLREIDILDGLSRTYKTHNKAIEIIDSFVFRGQRFLVYPLLSCTLLSKMPLEINKIVKIASELLEAISQFHKKGIIHCDLKPDNIMFTEDEALKVIDFGSACSARQKIYSYVQSRFYRAPEVIFEYPYDTAIDMWSFGCILVEMVSGNPLFVGKNEMEQLLSIMEYKGYPPNHMLKHSRKQEELTHHFHRSLQDNGNHKKAPSSKRLIDVVRYEQLNALVEACLEWDPKKRITAAQALSLPLFNGRFKNKKRRATAIHTNHSRKLAELY